MGRKYIIEIGRLERLYKAFIGAHGKPEITWLSPEVDLTPYTEPDIEQVRNEGYQQGLSDAWEAARKIAVNEDYGGLSTEAICKIFSTENVYLGLASIFDNFTASEAIEKLKAYEQEKERIQVGDEVITASGKAVVTGVGPVHFEYVCADGSIGYDEVKNVKKTGRTFPEIAEVLRKMKETE
jgi:hypothetical protein